MSYTRGPRTRSSGGVDGGRRPSSSEKGIETVGKTWVCAPRVSPQSQSCCLLSSGGLAHKGRADPWQARLFDRRDPTRYEPTQRRAQRLPASCPLGSFWSFGGDRLSSQGPYELNLTHPHTRDLRRHLVVSSVQPHVAHVAPRALSHRCHRCLRTFRTGLRPPKPTHRVFTASSSETGGGLGTASARVRAF